MISGILPVDKPQGWTSHDVVARVRRISGQRQVGHAGTLDPLATGLLLVVLGRATRFSSYLMNSPKTYRAEVVLGATTVTDDAEAPLQTRHDVSHLTLEAILASLPAFTGDIPQQPPAYAAVRQGGQKLYVLARQGIAVERHARTVTIHDIAVEYWHPPRLRLVINCGPGTYIRALARDLGAALGVGGYLHALRRTASGSFTIAEAVNLESLDRLRIATALSPADRAVAGLPAAVVPEALVTRVLSGNAIALSADACGDLRLYSTGGAFLALATSGSGQAKPFLLMNPER